MGTSDIYTHPLKIYLLFLQYCTCHIQNNQGLVPKQVKPTSLISFSVSCNGVQDQTSGT